jgi:RNA-directed DNA polymerase
MSVLLGLVASMVADRSLLSLVAAMLKAGVLSEGELKPSETGTPQGGVISPLLANLYLDGLDKLLESRSISHVRYADDMVLLCPTREAAEAALALVREWMAAAHLALHPEKTRVVDMTMARSYFDFLGYRFHRNHAGKLQVLVRPKSEMSAKDRVRIITRRLSGKSLAVTIEELNSLLKGFVSYFRHACRQQFAQLDQWIRARLRGLLRARQGRRGRGGSAHVRWPISYFEAQGLLSLAATWTSLQQPSLR